MDKSFLLKLSIAKDNKDELNILIDEYKPFIASCVSQFSHRQVEYGKDDELSIGMLAFTEAVKSYNEDKGGFYTFARSIINRRLIDYARQQNKYKKEAVTSFSTTGKEGNDDEEVDLTLEESMRRYSDSEHERERRMELEEIRNELGIWDIDFFDVAKASPKHNSTRIVYLEAIKHIMSDEETKTLMNEKRYFPIKSISEKLKINRKKLERGRNYIIAGFLIMQGDYENIREFINWR